MSKALPQDHGVCPVCKQGNCKHFTEALKGEHNHIAGNYGSPNCQSPRCAIEFYNTHPGNAAYVPCPF